VLLAPTEGERYEELGAASARAILSAIKARFDVVVVDCGAMVTEANAAAAEMADRTLLVVTPDVPALRAANRQLGLWERLHIRKPDDVSVIVNRVSKDNELQPDLARKVLSAPLAKVVIPAGFRALEAAVNAGIPERVEDAAMVRAFAGLAHELGVGPRPSARGARRLTGQSGQAAIETVGLVGLILLIGLVLWQAVLVGYTFVLAGHSARQGAGQVAVSCCTTADIADASVKAKADLPSAWQGGANVRVDQPHDGRSFVTVQLDVPALVPGLGSPIHVSAGAGTVVESDKP